MTADAPAAPVRLRWLRVLLAPAVHVGVGLLLIAIARFTRLLVPADLVFIALAAIAATGLVLIMGFSGQVSLGHAAFYGIGAYSTGILTVDQRLAPPVAMVIGLVISGLAAAVLGLAVFRLRGHFLAMATLAFGLFFFHLLTFAADLTGGNTGRGDIPRLGVGPWSVITDHRMFLVAWIVLGFGLLLAHNLAASGIGRALRATGASEIAAASSGVNVVRMRVGVFVVGALYGSLAGSLYAHYVTFVSPNAFGLLTSVRLLVIATIGGLGSIWGGLIGAVLITMLAEGARWIVPRFVEGGTGSYELIVYGGALVVVLVVFRRGVADAVAHALRSRRAASTAPRSGPRVQEWLR
jgi:branched-chain amino acid transport system permease protein